MLTAVELVLMIRGESHSGISRMVISNVSEIFEVYALHNRSRRVAMLLAFFLFAEIITTLLTWRAAVPKLHFSPTCFTKIPPNITVYFLYVISAATCPPLLIQDRQGCDYLESTCPIDPDVG